MKFEIDDTVLIETIVEKVVERLEPLIKASQSQANGKLMDVKELAEYLRVKPSWIYEKVHTRKIPFQKAGRFPRFRKKIIDKWLDNPYAFPDACKPTRKGGKVYE